MKKRFFRKFVVYVVLLAMFASLVPPLPARALAFETVASILLFGFNKLDNHVEYNPTTKGMFSAAQRLPKSLSQVAMLETLATDGNVPSNTVIHPYVGLTPYGETFSGVELYPYAQSVGRHYDYTRILINGHDITSQVGEKVAAECGLTYDAGGNRVVGMVDHISYQPTGEEVSSGRVTNIECVYSMQGGEKVSIAMGVQARTLIQVIALARLNESLSRYLDEAFRAYFANARVTVQDAVRPMKLTVQALTFPKPVQLIVYDTANAPAVGQPWARRVFVIAPGQAITIDVAKGKLVLNFYNNELPKFFRTPASTATVDVGGGRLCHYYEASDGPIPSLVQFSVDENDPGFVKGGK